MAPYGHIFVKRKTGEDGSCFPLLSRVCRIGKGHVCDIRIQREPVMEEHCLIEVGNDSQVRIKNLNKKCHTLVNGLPLSMDWLGLKHMDTIIIADRSFRWEYLKGSMFYSDGEQSTETNATPECGKLSENNSVPTAHRSLVPLQNVENGSSNIGPDLICFDSPLVVSDSKRQNRKSRSSMLNGNKLEASTKESPKVQTPKQRVSLRQNETEVPIFLSSPISLVNEEEISLQNKSFQSLPVAQYSELSPLDRNSDAQENSHTSLKSSIEMERKETKTEGMESDSTLNSRNGRRSSRRKSVALVVNTPIAQNQNAESSVFSTYFEDDNMSIEKEEYTPNETSKMLAQTSVVIENTPRALRITSSSTTSSDDCSESRALLKRNRVSGLNMTHEGSSFSALTPTSGKSSRSKKSVALKTKRDTNMCISDNPPFRSPRNSVKILVVPPTPEQPLENGEQVGVEVATNFIKFSVRKKSSIHVDLSGTNSQKSELAEQIFNSPSKVYKDTGVIGGEDICGRSDKLSGFLCKGEEKRFELQVNRDKSLAGDSVKNIAEVIGNGSFIMSETKKNTSCSRRMSSVQEYTKMDDSATPMYSRKQDLSVASINLVTDTKEGEWSVNNAVNTSQRKSLRGRNSQSFRTPKTPLGKDLASVYWSNDTDSSDITKTPLPSDDEYASWLSQRTSVASTNEEIPSSPITKRNLRQSTSKSCSQIYFENVRESMRKPLSISLNNSIPVPSRSKSIGGLSRTKEKTLSPVTRRSKRKSIATPYFVASIYNRLKTPATVGSKSFEVSEMEGNPKEFVTVRKKVHQVSTTEEINSDDVDYLSDLSSNNSCLEGDGMDSLIQTSSLMLDQSNVSDGRGHLAEKSQVKSSWTSTPAVSNSTRKKRVTFGTSLCSVDLGQMPLTPMKPDLVSYVEVSTPTGEYFSENSAANATENIRDSLKKNKSLTKTPPKQGLPSAPKISDAGPNNIESVVESSYNSALDNTVTIMNTPSLLDKDRSIMSLGSLQSCESSIGDSPVSNKNHRRRCPIDAHDPPNTNISLSVIDAKGKFQQTNKRKSSGSLSATPSAAQQGKKLEGQSSKKLNYEETTFTAPFIDVTLNPPGLPVESVTDVNGQEWNVTKDVPSRRESLRSRKSGNTSRANEHSSVFQDMTKTPVPSDEEYASWLSQISQRASLVSTNEANLSSPILQRSKRISNVDSCASSCFINEDMVAKTPLSISPTQLRSKSIDKTSSAKAKASPAIKRNKRKSVQSLGTPCFVASIYNRLKTPTSVGSKGFEVSDTGSNSLEFVTLRKKVNQMSTTQEMNSNDVDYLSDLSRNNSCLEDGEMDSLMQTSSLMLDQSDVLDANGHLAEESQVKSSWTSTPAVSNSTRKKRVTFGASLCSEDFGQIPSTPQNFEVACSEDVNTPAKSIYELSTASVTRSTTQSVTGKASITSCVKGNLEYHDNSTLRTGTLKSHFDSSAFNSILDDTSSLNSDTNVSELNTSQMSTRSLRSCKSVVNDGSNAAANTSKTESKRSSDARVSPSLVSTSWIFKREAEEMRKSANTLVSELKTYAGTLNAEDELKSQEGVQVETSIESGKRKSMRRKSLENSLSNVTPQIEKVTRISVNATPDYSESMKYLLKTPAVITMKTKEVEETHGMINEKLPTTTPRTDSPHIERERSFILSDLEQISPSTTSRRSLRLIRNSRSNSPECQQMENMASVRSSNEVNSSIDSESGKFASAEDEEEELDSHREGVQAASTKESGNSELASYKLSDGFKVTPQIRKVTRNSVNARPDNSESMKSLLETPAFNTLPVEGEEPAVIINDCSVIETPKMEVTHGDCRRSTTVTEVETISQSSSRSRKSQSSSRSRKSLRVNKISTLDLSCVSKSSSVDANSSLLSDSASFTSALNMEDAYHTEEDDIVLNTPMTGKRKSTLRKSSKASSLKVTPLMRKGAKKSESATPDYSESMKELMKTPAVSALPFAEEDLLIEFTNDESQTRAQRRNSSRCAKQSSMVAEEEVITSPVAINQSVNIDGELDSEEGVGLDTTSESGKRNMSSRRSSIASSFKVTPVIRNVMRKSVAGTPDFSESMKGLMKTPAVTGMPFAEEDFTIEITDEESQTQTQRGNSSRCANRSSMFTEDEVTTSPMSIKQSVNGGSDLDSEEDVALDPTEKLGERRFSGRKSSIASSFKATPLMRKVTRKSVAATPDYSESMKDLLKTPVVSAMQIPEEDILTEDMNEDSQRQTKRKNSSRPAKKSSMFTLEEVAASPMPINVSGNVEGDPDSEEDVALDATEKLGERRFSGRKSSIASSFKATPLMRKVTRKSVAATPDYSESMKDLLKTPAVSALQIPEEDNLTEDTNEDSQTQTQRRNSSRPEKKSSMFTLEEVAASPMPINMSVNVEGDPDSEEDVALDTTEKSGERRLSGRKSSIASSFKATPLMRKVTRKSVAATPDYSESMKDLLKTPAVSALQIPEEDILTEDMNEDSQRQTKRKNSSRPAKKSSMFTLEEVAASPMPINVSVNVEGDPDSEEDVALDTTEKLGERRFSGRKSSIASSFKATPLMRKVTRKSVAATPDYSESMKDLLKTPAVSALQIPEEDNLTEDTNEDSQTQTQRRNSSRPAKKSSMFTLEEVAASPMPINVSVNVEGDPDSEEDVALDTTEKSGERRLSGRKSSIASSFKATPLMRKVTRKSVAATPDYSESMKDLLKTPAVSALQIPEEDNLTEDTNEDSPTQTQRRNSSRPAKKSSMFTLEEVAASPMPINVSVNVEGDPDSEEDVALDTTEKSGERRLSGRKSSIASSFKATPLMRKVTRKSVAATPDYSESMKYLLKTPAVSALQIPEEDILTEDMNEDSQRQTKRKNSSRPAKKSSMFTLEEVAASPMPINVSVNVEGDLDSEEDVALDTIEKLGERRFSGRKSSIASSFKATPLMRKVTRKCVAATPDYSESMKDLLKTPAVSALQIPEEDNLTEDTNEDSQTQTQRRNSSRPAKKSSMFTLEEVAASPMPINVSVNVEGDPDSEEDVALDTTEKSGERRLSGRKSSIASSFKATPLMRKVTRKSVAATPEYSESMKDLLKTPAVSALQIPEEDNLTEDTNEDSQTQTQRRNSSRPAKKSSMFTLEEVAASPMPINVSVNVEGDPDSEEDVALDTTEKSGERRLSGRKSSIASSFKATPLMRKVTRKSVAATPDYSESMKDLLKTPAVSALQIPEEDNLTEDTNEDSQTQTQRRNSSRPAKKSSMFTLEEVAASPMPINVSANVEGDPDSEEDVTLDTTVESGKRRSSRRKSSIASSFQVTPLLMKVTSKSATPNPSDSTKDLLQTPDTTVMPEYENISMEVINEESLAIDGKSLEKVTISNELQVFCPRDSTNESIIIGEPSELEMRKSSVMEKRSGQSLPNVTKDSPALVNVTLSSSEKFPIAETTEKAASDDNLQLDLSSAGRRKSASRVSSEGHENLKCMKKWLVPRSPTSRYSDLRGIKELYTVRSPLSSYADVSGLKELFASPMVHLSKGEAVAKLVGEADNLNIEPTELDSCYGGKISSPYKNPVVLISKLSPVALISSTEENEPVIPVKPLRSGRNKKVALKNLRPAQKMKDVEVVDSNSDLPQSEFSISHNGKENKLKTKQSSERKDAGSFIIVKDLPNLNECSSIPDAVVDSVILKSNLRNIAGQRGLRKHVHFDAQAAEMAEKKIEPVNEDGPSVTRKSFNRKSVPANPSGTSLRGQEPPIGNEKSSKKIQHEEEANFAESRRRGNLRKRGMTEVLEKTVADSESNIPDDVSNTTKKGRVSKAEKQSSAVERSSRKKKADLLDEAVNSNETNADEIGDKGRGGSNKKADLVKAVEDKIEVESGTALSRQTRRTRGIERADDTVSVSGSKKTLSINTSSKDVNKTVDGLNVSPEKQLQKKPNTGGGNQNSDESAQQLTRRGKKVVKLEDTSSGVDITADKMGVKSKSVSQKREELAKDIEDKVAVESAPVLGRQTRRKRGMEGVDETAGNTDADKIDGKSRSGAKKKAESMKNVEEKVDVESEPTLSRRTRRAKGIEGNNDTVVLGIKNVEPKSKISKVKSLKEETSEDINSEQETENKEAKDPKSKKKIGKEATFKPEKQTSTEKDAEMPEKENNGEDSVAEPAIPAEKEDQSNEKSNENKTSKPGRQTAKKDDAKSEKKGKRNGDPGVKPKKLEEKKEVPCEKSTEENVEHVAVASNERRTRRGNVATSLDSGRDAKESESSKGRNSKRSTRRVGDDDGGEEVTLEKRSRRANNSVEKGDNVESEKKSSARSEVKKAVVVEPGVGVEVPPKLNTRRTKVTSCTGESSMKDSPPSSPERVQAEKLISEEKIISAIKEENATVERATRHKKNVLSRKDEGKNAVPEAPVTYAKEEQDISKLKKAVSTVKKKDEEKIVHRGRNLRNNKNTWSDTCEITETKRASRKRTAASSVSEEPSAVEEKSLPSQKKKESVSSLVVKTSKRIKLEEKDQDNGKEKVVAKKVPRRVLRKR